MSWSVSVWCGAERGEWMEDGEGDLTEDLNSVERAWKQFL